LGIAAEGKPIVSSRNIEDIAGNLEYVELQTAVDTQTKARRTRFDCYNPDSLSYVGASGTRPRVAAEPHERRR